MPANQVKTEAPSCHDCGNKDLTLVLLSSGHPVEPYRIYKCGCGYTTIVKDEPKVAGDPPPSQP